MAVFPLYTVEHGKCSCGREDCRNIGKHPIGSIVPRGLLDASNDPHTIKEFWSVYPDANIGVATGDVSGFLVFDVDPRHGGDRTLQNLEDRFEPLPDTWTVWTGGGGVHLYFVMPSFDVRNSGGRIGPGIDIRGNGGYVVAPPSAHESGNPYRWEPSRRPSTTELAQLPDWLVRHMSNGKQETARALPAKIGEGERNIWLASISGSMRHRGCSAESIEAALRIENRLRCKPPLDDREVHAIANSISRYTPAGTLRTRA